MLKMDLFGTLLTLTMFWKLSFSLECYNCENCPANFEERGGQYLKQCERSTMCFKRVTTLDFGNGLTSHSIERGCAPQTQDGVQKKTGSKWTPVNTIYEVYQEGCADDPSNSERTTDSILCYCRGDRCNGAAIYRICFGLFVTTIAILLT